MKIVPFNYMVQNGNSYCPKCSCEITSRAQATPPRTICKNILGFMLGCPKAEHFHRKCTYCGGKWIESTFEDSNDGAQIALRAAFESANRAGLSEEDVIEEWRLISVRHIMDS